VVTRRDLAEAQSYERRRIVTAFVSGSPGGHEVEPPRTGRQLLGGVVLAVLVMAGSAAAGHVGQLLDERDRPGAASAPDRGHNAKEPPTRTSGAPAGGG
jgi:Type VII secretion system ESX-1, transport TM domain B